MILFGAIVTALVFATPSAVIAFRFSNILILQQNLCLFFF